MPTFLGAVAPGVSASSATASGLYEDLTAEENVAFHLRIRGNSTSTPREALDRLGLEARLAGTPVARLSAGQRRRVALAALVASAPRLWLLDEPHAGLDEAARLSLDSLIGDAASGGAAVVVASHELEHAGRLASRRVRIESGRLDAKLPRDAELTPAPAPAVRRDPGSIGRPSMLRDAWAVAAKDLRIEGRSHVGRAQVVPFALVVVVLFGLALDPDRGVLTRAAPGLLWVTVLLGRALGRAEGGCRRNQRSGGRSAPPLRHRLGFRVPRQGDRAGSPTTRRGSRLGGWRGGPLQRRTRLARPSLGGRRGRHRRSCSRRNALRGGGRWS